MKNQEGSAAQPVYAIDIADFLLCAGSVIVGIKPLNQGSDNSLRIYRSHEGWHRRCGKLSFNDFGRFVRKIILFHEAFTRARSK